MKTSETNKSYARRENNNGYLCAKIVIDVIFVINKIGIFQVVSHLTRFSNLLQFFFLGAFCASMRPCEVTLP